MRLSWSRLVYAVIDCLLALDSKITIPSIGVARSRRGRVRKSVSAPQVTTSSTKHSCALETFQTGSQDGLVCILLAVRHDTHQTSRPSHFNTHQPILFDRHTTRRRSRTKCDTMVPAPSRPLSQPSYRPLGRRDVPNAAPAGAFRRGSRGFHQANNTSFHQIANPAPPLPQYLAFRV